MTHRGLITVEVIDIDRTGWHRFHNFAEDLWRLCQNDPSIDPLELQKTMDLPVLTAVVAVPPRLKHRWRERIRQLAATHLMSEELTITLSDRRQIQ